jgi:hypothetical protein
MKIPQVDVAFKISKFTKKQSELFQRMKGFIVNKKIYIFETSVHFWFICLFVY